MKIQVLFFGITRDIIGKRSVDLDVLESTSVYDLKEKLKEQYNELKNFSFSIAINEAYAEENQLLKDNDVVAFIPPVSGG